MGRHAAPHIRLARTLPTGWSRSARTPRRWPSAPGATLFTSGTPPPPATSVASVSPAGPARARWRFSPDGTLLAAITSNGSGYVWDVGTDSEISSLNGGQGTLISGVAFSPDGTVVAYSASAGFIHLWDVKSRRQIGSF